MRTHPTRLARLALVGAIALSATCLVPLTASADFGPQRLEQAADGRLTLQTAFACSASATHAQTWMTGPGFPAAPGIDVTGGVPLNRSAVRSVPGESLTLSRTLPEFAAEQLPVAPLVGIHNFVTVCQNDTGSETHDTFQLVVDFLTPDDFRQMAADFTATVSIDSAIPSSSQVPGMQVTFEGTVTPLEADGRVELWDGDQSLGSAPVVAGAFSVTTTELAIVGARRIVPVFTPIHDVYSRTELSEFAYEVTAARKQDTITTLAAPTASAAGSKVELTATVVEKGSDAPQGSVDFVDGSKSVGSAPLDADGIARLEHDFGVGTHTLRAIFQPEPDSLSAQSQSQPVSLSTSPAPTAPTPDEQAVQGEVPPGTIIISTPYTLTNPLDLGVLTLDPSGAMFSASAPFEGIGISDSRGGNLPWTASAMAESLLSGDIGEINGQNVGLTDVDVVYTPGNALSAENPVTVTNRPAANPAVAPDDLGELGLGGAPHAFAHAENGAGSVTINALLTVNAPSSTPAGTYNGVVTFTVFGS